MMTAEHIHFVTGRLAENALRRRLSDLSEKLGFSYSIQVLPITVAALMSPAWIAKRIKVPEQSTKVILPGYCNGDLTPLTDVVSVPVHVGPKDLHNLDVFFGMESTAVQLDKFDIEILAEINHAPRLETSEVIRHADALAADGADIIDIGCEPGYQWTGVSEIVKMLIGRGYRVSIDSFNSTEIESAVQAGAELVLSVNSQNRHAAADWGCEVVVIPDQPSDLASLDESIAFLTDAKVKMRLDPILEPIGFGFATSLLRYFDTRARWPDLPMMMGIGNLTELSDVDSAGVNFLLLAICQELQIHSVLTTQVINWCRTSVKEIEIARRILYFSVTQQVPPKHLSNQLLQLRDARITEFDAQMIKDIADTIKDNNVRLFADGQDVHALTHQFSEHDRDPFVIFDKFAATNPKNLTPSHAFYLGYEMCKAMIANQLGKNYTQDEALSWGHLTVDEKDRHRLGRKKTTPPL
jgi:dihydropteroate synthase-like protein